MSLQHSLTLAWIQPKCYFGYGSSSFKIQCTNWDYNHLNDLPAVLYAFKVSLSLYLFGIEVELFDFYDREFCQLRGEDCPVDLLLVEDGQSGFVLSVGQFELYAWREGPTRHFDDLKPKKEIKSSHI